MRACSQIELTQLLCCDGPTSLPAAISMNSISMTLQILCLQGWDFESARTSSLVAACPTVLGFVSESSSNPQSHTLVFTARSRITHTRKMQTYLPTTPHSYRTLLPITHGFASHMANTAANEPSPRNPVIHSLILTISMKGQTIWA